MYAWFLKFFMLLGVLGLGATGVGLYYHFRPEPLVVAPSAATTSPGFAPAVSTALQTFRSSFVSRFRANCEENARRTVQAQRGSLPPAIETQIAGLCACSADYVMDQMTPEDVGEMTTSLLKGHGAQPTEHIKAAVAQAVPHCAGASGVSVKKP